MTTTDAVSAILSATAERVGAHWHYNRENRRLDDLLDVAADLRAGAEALEALHAEILARPALGALRRMRREVAA